MKKIYLISDRITAIDLLIERKWLRILSVYLPHVGYILDEFLDCMTQLNSLVMEAQDRMMNVIVAGDFNVSLEDIGARLSLLDLDIANIILADNHDDA